MIIDILIQFFHDYGIFFLLLLGTIKLILLIQYKPHRPSYAFKNFFTFYDRYSLRNDKVERWEKMRKICNPVTIGFYIILGLCFISQFVYFMTRSK